MRRLCSGSSESHMYQEKETAENMLNSLREEVSSYEVRLEEGEEEVRKLEEQLLALLVRQPQQQSSGAGQELATGQPAQRPWWHGT